MSTTIGQYGGDGASIILSAAIDNITLMQQQNTWQTSAGTLAETYAGVGDTRQTAISLNPKITQVASWQSNITNTQTNLSITATAMTQIVGLAQSLSTGLMTVTGTSSTTAVATVVEQAKGLLSELATALNTQSGATYVFAGQDGTEAPVTDPTNIGSSAMATSIASAVSGLTSSNVDSVLADATTAASNNAAGTSVFSSNLSVSATTAASLQASVVMSTTSTKVGLVATQNSTTSSASPTSTGSPIRDLVSDLMVVASMGGMSSETPGYTDLVTKLNTSLNTTIGQLTDMEAQVGVQQSALTTRATALTSVNTMLTTQLSDARNADAASASTAVLTLKTQLEASLTLVADMKNMSLASYL
jgi:flagellar hook-associated protein 3 FlgL